MVSMPVVLCVRNLSVNGQDLGQALIKAGHAKAYAGGKRKPWC